MRAAPASRRSWLASEGVLKPDTRLKGPFAGKPAPTEGRQRIRARDKNKSETTERSSSNPYDI
nr:hypothetical protein FFPRI1PSEUD_12660 [Pseudomonas sp. FFPRI_1]